MSKVTEFFFFVGIAVAAHSALWIGIKPAGSEASGTTGAASVTLLASSGDVSEMVAEWNRPIETMAHLPDAPVAPDLARSAMVQHQKQATDWQGPSPTISQVEALSLPMATFQPEAPPVVDTTTPKIERPDRAPETSRRPPNRPVVPTESPPEPAKESIATKAQNAADGQTGTNAGRAEAQRSASLSKSQRQSLLAQWGASIRNGVERRKKYPHGTKASGTTVLRISVSRDGRLAGVSVVSSSGDKKLDQAAVLAVRKASYPAAPKGLVDPRYKFNLPVAFSR